jgi:hypothetical protein
MRKVISSNLGFGLAALLTTTPAWAGAAPVPVPEVAGGMLAVGMLGLGYRLLRRRFMR